ncbi:hypothetical protein E5676_scaffold142G002760 [Cucumis melo var. makuwa]|uniref:Uncharacterized protein n=1 Tax=Cucumis melo var. makuwa TaxID=1194695 RepID=A0A5D3DI20_CUCMM|nr:hypothetical protein E5676_scaffold142G002760 [Cucumis melo var. makuwa]
MRQGMRELGLSFALDGEFVYNNNYQATIDMTPFEALYGKGKGRGKLASNREESVTCHMGT